MAQLQKSLREIFAKNLNSMIEVSGLSPPTVASRAGVDRKTVNNYTNARTDPRPDHVDAIARVFGIEAWLLMSESFDPEISINTQFMKLMQLYRDADPTGRDNILRIAEMAPKQKR